MCGRHDGPDPSIARVEAVQRPFVVREQLVIVLETNDCVVGKWLL
jgi:hypothetical protein